LTDKEEADAFTEDDEIAVTAIGIYAAVAIHNHVMLTRQRSLVNGLIMALEEERRAIAYDLHDGLTQFVMASHAHLEAFKSAHAKGSNERAAAELDAGMRYLKEAVLESRRMVNGLRTLALDDLGLAGALEQIIDEEQRRAGWIDADFVHNIAGERFDRALETTVYRVAQESLTNARKHAQATRVRLTLLVDEKPGIDDGARCLRLEVRDWGRGFDSEQARRDDSRVGLHSMFERVHNVGGEWTIESTPGKGTIVRATMPAHAVTPSSN
jgi:two-component system NarL family sensor kinase